MRQLLQVLSWIGVVIGALAILGAFGEVATNPSGASYSLIGGLLFASQGGVALAYINKVNKGEK